MCRGAILYTPLGDVVTCLVLPQISSVGGPGGSPPGRAPTRRALPAMKTIKARAALATKRRDAVAMVDWFEYVYCRNFATE